MALLFLLIVCALIGAMMLGRFHKELTGILLGLFLGPIGLIFAWIIRSNAILDAQQRPQTDTTGPAPTRECPHCAERILVKAKVCRYCGRDVPVYVPPRVLPVIHPRAPSATEEFKRNPRIMIALIVIIVLTGIFTAGVIEYDRGQSSPESTVPAQATPAPADTAGSFAGDGDGAILAVQRAKMVVPDKGRSSEAVQNVVAYFDSAFPHDPHASKSIGWRAEKTNAGSYTVSLDYWNAGKRDVAQWSFDPKTKRVLARNHLAELLSWMPAE